MLMETVIKYVSISLTYGIGKKILKKIWITIVFRFNKHSIQIKISSSEDLLWWTKILNENFKNLNEQNEGKELDGSEIQKPKIIHEAVIKHFEILY